MKSLVLTSDCDHLLTDEHLKILRILSDNEIFITTAVFAKVDNDNSWLGKHCSRNDTHGWLDNKKLKQGLIEAQSMGHEIAFHGTSQCSNTRSVFLRGIDEYKKAFGDYPFTYIEHGPNPIYQPHLSFKKELLDNKVNKYSQYYIKDIIEDIFSICWTQKFLLGIEEIPTTNKEWLIKEDNINYIYRIKMTDFPKFKKQIRTNFNNQLSFIGYTHFGYNGYYGPRRENLLNLFRPFFPHRFEFWKGKNFKRNICEIKEFIKQNDFKTKTIKDFVLLCQK